MTRFRYIPKAMIEKIPKSPGIYVLSEGKKMLYIGKAVNVRERVKNHFQQPSYRDHLFLDRVTHVGYVETQSDIDALLLESKLIKKYQPKYNIMWRDDKKYFYVGIDLEGCAVGKEKQLFPRIFITHQPNHASRITNLASGTRNLLNTRGEMRTTSSLGPFVDGKSLKQVLRLLRRVFPYYTVKKHPPFPCSYCQLGLCPGPDPERKTYERNIRNLIAVLKGGRMSVLRELQRNMKQASESQQFERAAQLRDQIFSLQRIFEHAYRIFPQEISSNVLWPQMENVLQKLFRYPHPITRLEAYDISNIQGKQATGSMVTFIKGKPARDFYRKFKMKISGTPNDFAMMKELIERRLSHPEWGYPDVMIMDGGKPQLSAALAAYRTKKTKSAILFGALAKRRNELFLPNRKRPLLLRDLPKPVRNLFLHLRDEAHRFAVRYHRVLRRIDLLKER